jgi:AGZA family xanthine/uracil permease-like MFS transporter
MSYIVVLNPLILGFAKDANGQYLGGGTEPNLAAIAAATALVAGVMTILMGVLGNFPLALATGLGLNAFVAFGVASQMTWADAMGLIVLEGVVIMLLVLTGLREKIFTVVPRSLRVAISVGIGLFITLVGLVDAGVVKRIPDAANTTVPVQLGLDGALNGWPVLLFVAALLLLIALYVKKVKGAFLIAISVATVAAIVLENIVHAGSSVKNSLGWALNVPSIPDSVVASPVFSTFGQFNLFGSFESIGFVSALLRSQRGFQ